MSEQSGNICGGISNELSGDKLQEALRLLDATLTTLADKGTTLQVIKVNSVTSQVVAGMLYRYKVDLSQDDAVKNSEVKIWSRPWLKENGTNITITIDGDDNVIDSTF